MENFYDFLDLLKRVGKSEPVVRRMVRLGELPAPTHRRGRRPYWLRSEVDAAIENLSLPVPLAPPAGSEK